jgi:hypothetical protein
MASATDLTVLSPTGIISRNDPIQIAIQITNFTTFLPGYADNLSMIVEYGAQSCTNLTMQLMPGNGTYFFNVPSDQLPFDNVTYTIETWFTGGGYTIQNFSINGLGQAWAHKISLKGFDPYAYNLQGLHVVKGGFKWQMTTDSPSETVYILLVDGENKLIAYGTRSVSYTSVGTIYSLGGIAYPYGFTWHSFAGGVNTNTTSFFLPRGEYTEFVGVQVGTYTRANTRLTMLDGTGIGGDTREAWWSCDNFNTGTKVYLSDWSKTKDFFGYFSYFQTFPAPGESISGLGNNQQWSAVMSLRSYSNSVGLPWLVYMIGLIIIIAFVGTVYKFAQKFNISIPNYVYLFFITAGVTLNWVIGLFDTWMFLFFISTELFASLIKFREPISKALETIRPNRTYSTGEPAEKEAKIKVKKLYRKDGGVRNGR